MAAMEDDVTALKGQYISVSVEEALIDVLVVAFQFGAKTFHGALLDITKKNRPFGVNCSWFSSSSGGATPVPEESKTEDRLFSLKQRHTYFEQGPPLPDLTGPQLAKARRAVTGAKIAKDQGVRMRRLRPRQVLCSQCRSICNENSENVQKKATASTSLNSALSSSSSAPSSSDSKIPPAPAPPPVSVPPTKPATNCEVPVTMVPTASVPRGVLTRSSQPILPPPPSPAKPVEVSHTATDEYRASSVVQGKMILRKRKLDEEPEDPSPTPGLVVNPNPAVITEARAGGTPPVPVLRITFANAEGTVVKIAACDASTKAARKALKKAKKEAQRRKGQQNLAPEDSPTSILPHRHRKHHKRKRKRRDENEVGDEEVVEVREQGWGCSKDPFTEADLRPAEGLYEEVRNNCLRQKLSISLKRLNAQAYARLSPKHGSHHHHHHHHGHHHNNHDELPSVEDEEDAGSDDGRVPDFPRHEPLQPHPQAQATATPAQSQQSGGCRPLMMRITSQSVNRCVLEGGREMSVGDVVWGKIHGFPWWPGKVLSLTVSRREGGGVAVGGVPVAHQAHVAWFGSSTSSYMPCHQLAPFLRYFKARYNRKKRGPYKEAIRQAQLEAQRLQPPLPVPPPPPLSAEEPLAQVS